MADPQAGSRGTNRSPEGDARAGKGASDSTSNPEMVHFASVVAVVGVIQVMACWVFYRAVAGDGGEVAFVFPFLAALAVALSTAFAALVRRLWESQEARSMGGYR